MAEKNVTVSADVLQKTAEFTAEATEALEQVSVKQAALASEVPGCVDTLIKQGLLQESDRASLVQRYTDDPSSLAKALTKVAQLVVPVSMGQGSEISGSKAKSADEKFAEAMLGN